MYIQSKLIFFQTLMWTSALYKSVGKKSSKLFHWQKWPLCCFKSGLYSLQSSFRIRSARNFVENRATLQYFLRIDSLNILNLCFVNSAFKCREIQRAGQLSVPNDSFPSQPANGLVTQPNLLPWKIYHQLCICPCHFELNGAARHALKSSACVCLCSTEPQRAASAEN